MSTVLADHADLRVSAKQTAEGFARTVEKEHVSFTDVDNSGVTALLQSTTDAGPGTGVAAVTGPRINLLSAAMIAAVAVVVYLLVLVRDAAAAQVALQCMDAQWSGCSDSDACDALHTMQPTPRTNPLLGSKSLNSGATPMLPPVPPTLPQPESSSSVASTVQRVPSAPYDARCTMYSGQRQGNGATATMLPSL